MSSDDTVVMIINNRMSSLHVRILNPPWCHRQGILGTGPGSEDPSCKQCPWRSSCGEVG